MAKQKVAIVHDWLVGGGAELVVQELHAMFPEAPIYTSYCTDEWRKKLDNKVVTGFLQHWPFSALRKYIAPLRIWWFTHLDLSGYDLVISSSGNGEAKAVKTPPATTHVCYCHSPTHFYWRHYEQYQKNPGFLFGSVGLKLLVKPLRAWDKKAAGRPDFFVANSTHIQKDIKKYYGRESVVVHPPVNTERFSRSDRLRSGFVTVGRQVPYKKVDIIVRACSELSLPLTVIGRGPDHNKLRKLAGDSITFLDNASDKEVEKHMGEASAFIIAAFEDFGITPVEALASGTPVIAYKAGGALDYVVPKKTGLFFEKQSVSSLKQTLLDFEKTNFSTKEIAAFAQKFSQARFAREMNAAIQQATKREE